MSKQTKSNFSASLQSLALIFAIFFVMAFACDKGGNNQRLSEKEGDNPRQSDNESDYSQDEAFTYQKGVGKKYGTRDPRTCANTKAPTTGAITAALARKYFMCREKESQNTLYLFEDVKVEVGSTISYSAIRGQYSFDQIDVNQPVYQIRGSYTSYSCVKVYEENAEPSCNVENVKGNGYCYKTTFGDWRCYY